MPARASDDLPCPDAPVRIRTPPLIEPRQALLDLVATSEEAILVAHVVGRQTQVRTLVLTTGGVARPSSCGSCVRIACSRSTSSRPGSIPNSSTSVRRARCRVRSASAWRPHRYWAVARIAHRCSRRGAASTMRLGGRRHLAMLSRLEPGDQHVLLDAAPHLLEPCRPHSRRPASARSPRRAAAPQSERPVERRRRPVRFAAAARVPGRARRAARTGARPRRRGPGSAGSHQAGWPRHRRRASCGSGRWMPGSASAM